MPTIKDRVIDLTADSCDKKQEDIKLESRFDEDLELDSLDRVELVMRLEDEFDIEIPDLEAEKIKTVGEAITAIGKVVK